MPPTDSHLLGPFIGNVTASTAAIWLQIPNLAKDETRTVFVTLHEGAVNAQAGPTGTINASYEALNVGIVRFDALKPDTVYFYKLWKDAEHKAALDTNGLVEDDLHFQTLPTNGFNDQMDFLLMSCHNPDTAPKDGADGFAVWARIPDIINENKNVRFAILAGDQIYADDKEAELLKEQDLRKRQELYLIVYTEFWDYIYYRKVLCSLPAYLMWDDHDLTDGWGSRVDSFRKDQPSVFKDDWLRLFEAAQSTFKQMQASRNPEPLPQGNANRSFDFCFKIGKVGFAVPDLRSNRNVRVPRIMLPEQLDAIRKWVNDNKDNLDVLFFVSTVVFSHDAPKVTGFILNIWFVVLSFVGWLKKLRILNKFRGWFDRNIGDLRDDINDSWGARVNRRETDRVLDFLFELQNPANPAEALNVVILSGDIHTPGYSTIYSADPGHQAKAVIPHIVATPVAYSPLHWLAEAIFRHLSTTIELGEKKTYSAQVSHHFCHRNVVVVSFRKFAGIQVDEPEVQLKVKYYLEGFPEPQIMLFDLNRSSHRESIGWPDAQSKQATSGSTLSPRSTITESRSTSTSGIESTPLKSTNLTIGGKQMQSPRSNLLTQGTANWLDEHLRIVEQKILDEASRLAKRDNREGGIEPKDIAEAAKRFAPGNEIPSVPDPVVDKPNWRDRIFSWTPSPILVSALLAVAFGVLGVYRGGQGAFDIAKVFAGAIVGSAAATVRSNAKQK